MSKKQVKLIQYFFFLVLGIFMLYYALKDIDFTQLANQLPQLNGFYIFMIVVVGVSSFFFRAIRWKMMIDTMGKKVKLYNVVMSVCIGYFVNLVTPRLGEIARCGIINRYEGVELEKVAGTMVVERLVDLICLIVLFIISLLFNSEEFLQMFGADIEQYDSASLLQSGLTMIVAVVLIYFLVRLGMSFLKKYAPKTYTKLNRILLNLKDGLLSIRNIENKERFFLQTLLLWGAYLLMVYFGFLAFPGLAHLGIDAALLVLIFGSVGMIITPGGIGAYQLIVQNTLVTIYGIGKTIAGGFALLSWALQTLLMIASGALSWFLLPIFNDKKNIDGNSSE